MEMKHVAPFTNFIGAILLKNERLKSLMRFELIALMSEVAVEMIAASTAHPTIALIQGLVICDTAVMSTLPPGCTCNPVACARDPKVTGTMQMIIVKTPAQNAARETTFPEAPAKQRCPISCSMSMKSSGMRSQPVN